VTIDASGNLVIADQSNRRIRKMDTNGIISTVAGNGTFGYTGEGGPATNASMYGPYTLVPHADGSVTLDFASVPDTTNVVLCATNLLPPIVWQSLSTNVAGADGDWQYADTDIAGLSVRFYRSATASGP
jgi:hypothetical protein